MTLGLFCWKCAFFFRRYFAYSRKQLPYIGKSRTQEVCGQFFLENNGIIEFRVSLASKVIPLKLREKSGVLQSQLKFHEFPIPGYID